MLKRGPEYVFKGPEGYIPLEILVPGDTVPVFL